jgi:hypothetical protein
MCSSVLTSNQTNHIPFGQPYICNTYFNIYFNVVYSSKSYSTKNWTQIWHTFPRSTPRKLNRFANIFWYFLNSKIYVWFFKRLLFLAAFLSNSKFYFEYGVLLDLCWNSVTLGKCSWKCAWVFQWKFVSNFVLPFAFVYRFDYQ